MGPGNLVTPPKLSTDPTPEEILAAARQRIETREPVEPGMSEQQRAWALRANRMVFHLSKHWLAFFNLLIGLFLGGAFLPPLLMHWGMELPATLLYQFYKAFCHQIPFRSWLLFGQQLTYPYPVPTHIDEFYQLRSLIGDSTIGYKIAVCQRDVAIYGTMLLAGLAFNWIRKGRQIRPLSPLFYALSIVPMGLDGGIQWISYLLWWFFTPGWMTGPHETTPLLRVLTGGIFGLGTIALGYPHLEGFFQDIRTLLAQRYNWH